MSQGNLVSMISHVVGGLEKLQQFGITPRVWERLRTEEAFARVVARKMLETDIELAGNDSFEVRIPGGSTRESLLQEVENVIGNSLRTDIVRAFSGEWAGVRDYAPSDLVCDRSVQLVTVPLFRHFDWNELLFELQARKLKPALTEDALMYVASGRGVSEGGLIVPGAHIKEIDGHSGPVVLAFDFSIAGYFMMSLRELGRGFSGGSCILAKPIEA